MEPGKVIPRTLTPLADIDMRQLADTSDARDVFLSVYLPTATGEQERLNRAFVSSRVRAVRDALSGDVGEDFEDTLATVEDLLYHAPVPGERGRVVFASARKDFLHVYRIGVEPGRRLVLDNSPFILPLAKLMDDYEDYGILLMDSRKARLYTVRSRVMEQVGSESIDLMNRHKKGGMSQKRFNRLRRGQISSFISEVVEDLGRLEDLQDMRGLVIAGPGGVKEQLREALPRVMRDRVIGMVDVSIDVAHDELLARGEEAARLDELADDRSALEELRRAIFKDRLAATGVEEVRDALVQGRVDTLLIGKDLSIPGWICEGCKAVSEGPGACRECGETVSRAEIVNELYELAERTGAGVEVVGGSEFLGSIGGLGAILRY